MDSGRELFDVFAMDSRQLTLRCATDGCCSRLALEVMVEQLQRQPSSKERRALRKGFQFT